MKLLLLLLFFPVLLVAEITLISPAPGEKIFLLPENQRKLAALPSHEERVKLLASHKSKGLGYGLYAPDCIWKSPIPIQFSWRSTGKGKKVFALLVSETQDFKKYKTFFCKSEKISVPPVFLNLHPGKKYYWRVAGPYGKELSPVSSFVTDPQPPRWIMLEGSCKNIRDLGGYKTKVKSYNFHNQKRPPRQHWLYAPEQDFGPLLTLVLTFVYLLGGPDLITPNDPAPKYQPITPEMREATRRCEMWRSTGPRRFQGGETAAPTH